MATIDHLLSERFTNRGMEELLNKGCNHDVYSNKDRNLSGIKQASSFF